MSGMTDKDLIADLGGPARVADLLGYDKAGGIQRVHNWTVRGIPAAVRLAFPHLFMRDVTGTTGPSEVAARDAAQAGVA